MSKKFIVSIGTVMVSVSLLVGCGTSSTNTSSTQVGSSESSNKKQNKSYSSDYSSLTTDEKNELLVEMINGKQSSEDILDLCIAMYPYDKEKANLDAVVSTFLAHGYDEADKIAKKVYEGDKDAYIGVMYALSMESSSQSSSATGNVSDIEIGDFVFKVDGNYDYVKGDVINNGSRTIRYMEIVAKYKDANGNVIDSDWTNCTDIDAGDSAYYEIMHKNVDGTKSVEVKINNVKFE